ncbi:MAG TPA: hypothetical protein VFT09_02240 [Ilumatobacteraceae bacterium]|nr:hypothetical protein [Ilumatobacteraceae bacterium]
MSWRDDLPDIPTERIRREVMSEGGARRADARRRRNSMLTGAGLAAVVVLGVAGLVALDGPDDDDGDAASTVTAPAGTAAAATTRPRDTATAATAGGTEAPADTAASEATEAAEATVPFVAGVVVEPTTVWEVPPGGAAACGPVTFEVTATAPGARRAVAIVRSTVTGRRWCSPASRRPRWSPAAASSCSSRWSRPTPPAGCTAPPAPTSSSSTAGPERRRATQPGARARS